MTSEVATVAKDATVADAVEMLRGLDEDFEAVRYVYLVDEDRRLTGVVTLNALIVAAPETRLAELATADLVTASPEDDQEDVAEDIAKYDLLAMPVVNDEGRLLGIVTVDDALDVLEEEHAEDLRVAGGTPDGDDSGHASTLIWLMRRNAWVLLWALGVLALAATCALVPAVGGRLDPAQILAACAPLAVTLVLADDSVSYVTNFFLEHDPDDEDAPSMLGFTFRGIGIGAVAGLFVALIVSALVYALHGLASSGALPRRGARRTWGGARGGRRGGRGGHVLLVCDHAHLPGNPSPARRGEPGDLGLHAHGRVHGGGRRGLLGGRGRGRGRDGDGDLACRRARGTRRAGPPARA